MGVIGKSLEDEVTGFELVENHVNNGMEIIVKRKLFTAVYVICKNIYFL